MNYTKTSGGNMVNITVEGDLTITELHKTKEITEAVTGKSALIDISKVSFIDSSGIGEMLHWKDKSTNLTVTNPTEKVAAVLKATKMDEVLTIKF